MGGTLQEQEAIRRCQAGEMEALGTLYELHKPAVFRTAYGITGNYDQAEDVTQQVFIELMTAIKRYDPGRPFLPWLRRIAVHRSLDAVKPHKYRPVPIDEFDNLPSPDPPPEDKAEDSEQRDAIWAAVGALGPKHRAVVVLYYFHELGEAEISKALGCLRVTVRVRLYYARARLREILEARGSPLTCTCLSNPEIPRYGRAAVQTAGSTIPAPVEVEQC